MQATLIFLWGGFEETLLPQSVKELSTVFSENRHQVLLA